MPYSFVSFEKISFLYSGIRPAFVKWHASNIKTRPKSGDDDNQTASFAILRISVANLMYVVHS